MSTHVFEPGEQHEERVNRPKGPRNRPRARLVCQACRQRKIKCDSEKTQTGLKCTPCEASNSPCIVNPESNRRKLGHSRQRMIEMQERIQSLESIVKQTTQLEPESTEEAMPTPGSTEVSEFANQSLQDGDTQGAFAMGHTESVSQAQPKSRRHTAPTLNVEPFHGHRNSLPIFRPPSFVASSEPADEPGYYGSTTQPHIHHEDSNPAMDSPESDVEDDLSVNMDSYQLRNTILRTFFKIQPYSQVIVQEDLFMRARAQGKRSRYYSTFLENVLLASGARHRTSSAVRRLSPRYSEHAKAQIASELETPNIASLQAFLIMSDLEAIKGRPRVGWTYSVIASGLLVDLSLHIDPAQLLAEGRLTQEEAAFRDLLLLGTFVYATLWSLYLGRPTSISALVLSAVRRAAANYDIGKTIRLWVELCFKMLDIIEILNGRSLEAPMEDSVILSLSHLNTGLRFFFSGLPKSVTVDDAQVDELDAEVYGPHLQYCGIQIILHRAIIKSGQTSQRQINLGGHNQLPTLSTCYAIVHDNAMRIARLILSFRRIFGLESMITIMMDAIYLAAVALTSHALRMQQEGRPIEREARWIRLLYETLEGVEKHFPVTAHMRSNLINVLEKTPLAYLFVDKFETSPNSLPESMTSLPRFVPPDTAGFSGLGGPSLNASELMPGLDFTFTTQDNFWLQDATWNGGPWLDELNV